MKPLFPYFGGKSRIAPKIWEHLGDVGSYVEPFFGSGAVLAARPHRVSRDTHAELVNDLNGWLVNAWRAVQRRPDLVYERLRGISYSEHDLRAAKLLVYSTDLSEKLEDFYFFDEDLAACWLAIMGGLIGNGGANNERKGSLSTSSKGRGVWRPDSNIKELERWSKRLQDVRIMTGSWDRCLSSDARMGGNEFDLIGVYLDPPYADGDNATYGEAHTDEPALASAKWAIEHGDDPNMRIIYSGYEGTVEFPETWRMIEWEAYGGYGRRGADGQGRQNAKRERLWASPHCLDDAQATLF